MTNTWIKRPIDELTEDDILEVLEVTFENGEVVAGTLLGINKSASYDLETFEVSEAVLTELDIIVQRQVLSFLVTEDDTIKVAP